MLKMLFFIVVLAALLAVVLAITKGKDKAKNDGKELEGPWPFKPRDAVMTEVEQTIYWRLVEALPGMVVLAQVGLSRVIEVQKGTRAIALE